MQRDKAAASSGYHLKPGHSIAVHSLYTKNASKICHGVELSPTTYAHRQQKRAHHPSDISDFQDACFACLDVVAEAGGEHDDH